MDLAALGLSKNTEALLRKARLETAEDVLLLSGPELAAQARLPAPEAAALLRHIFARVYPTSSVPRTAQDLFRCRAARLSTGDAVLDGVLGGGLTPGITEVFGKSGVGKTQLGLQLCAMAAGPKALGGLDGGAIYISTEQPFPVSRFHDIAAARFPSINPIDILDRTHIVHIRDHETQQHILTCYLGATVVRLNARVVVVDSIAANFRGGDVDVASAKTTTGQPSTALADRAGMLYEVGRALKQVADTHGCVIVCLNQVVDVFAGIRQHHYQPVNQPGDFEYQNDQTAPTLGLAWSNMVTTRVRMSRVDRFPAAASSFEQQQQGKPMDAETASLYVSRTLQVGFAPHLPASSCRYSVTLRGVVGLA
ncbi:P-loop containing nucleoside triphosphate hydrolase protein [Geranomyces variabilis]|nr:P-loop containing nucleoside triphosphate hydrolase protein [Geranomyces variabilis]KAJ3138640.1 DNA repair protein xrcc3 [Geranomyces variabilis]